MLLSIDPGANSGWAVYDNSTLVACGRSVPPAAWLEGVTDAVIERPRIYPHGRTRNPNDIVTLAVTVGELAGALRAYGIGVRYVEPRQWKGTLDANTCCRRAWARLREDERAVAAKYEPPPKGDVPGTKHNVLDAIGLGLWQVGRFKH